MFNLLKAGASFDQFKEAFLKAKAAASKEGDMDVEAQPAETEESGMMDLAPDASDRARHKRPRDKDDDRVPAKKPKLYASDAINDTASSKDDSMEFDPLIDNPDEIELSGAAGDSLDA